MRFAYLRAVLVSVLLLDHSCHAVYEAKRLLKSRGVNGADQDERMARIHPGHLMPLGDVNSSKKILRFLFNELKIWRAKIPRKGLDSIISTSFAENRLKRLVERSAFDPFKGVWGDVSRYRSSTLTKASLSDEKILLEFGKMAKARAMLMVELLQLFPETMDMAMRIEQHLFKKFGTSDHNALAFVYDTVPFYEVDGHVVIAHYIRNFFRKFHDWQSTNNGLLPPIAA